MFCALVFMFHFPYCFNVTDVHVVPSVAARTIDILRHKAVRSGTTRGSAARGSAARFSVHFHHLLSNILFVSHVQFDPSVAARSIDTSRHKVFRSSKTFLHTAWRNRCQAHAGGSGLAPPSATAGQPGGNFPGETPEGAAILANLIPGVLKVRFPTEAKPKIVMTDRGRGFFRPANGRITPEWQAALQANGLRPLQGDDAGQHQIAFRR